MEIKLKVRKLNPIETTVPLPVSTNLKARVDKIKDAKKYDINGMMREYLEKVVTEIETTLAS